MGSCNEFESDLIVGRDVKLIPVRLFTQLGDEVSGVRKSLPRAGSRLPGAESRQPQAGSRQPAAV